MDGALNLNGKRPGEPPNDERPTSHARFGHINGLSYQFKILANVDPKAPFFTETAREIFDAYALQATPTLQDVEVLLGGLKEQGGDAGKQDTARKIWTEALDLQVIKALASRLRTVEAAEVAIRAFIAGLRQTTGVTVTAGRENAIVSNTTACFARGNSQDECAPNTLAKLSNGPEPATGPAAGVLSGVVTVASATSPVQNVTRALVPPATAMGEASTTKGIPSTAAGVPPPATKADDVNTDDIDRLIQQESQNATANKDIPSSQPAKSRLGVVSQDETTDRLGPHGLTPKTTKPSGPATVRISGLKVLGASLPPPSDVRKGPILHQEQSGQAPTSPRAGHYDSYRPVPHVPVKREMSPLDRPLSDIIPHARRLRQDEQTCWFWFSTGGCKRRGECRYRHELLDYVATYSPRTHSSESFKIIKRDTLQETRRVTLAALRGEPERSPSPDDSRAYDPYERPVQFRRRSPPENQLRPAAKPLATSDTPIVDALVGDMVITHADCDKNIMTVLARLRDRRNQSSKDFVERLYNANGKISDYSISSNSGLYSKLAGLWGHALSPSSFSAAKVKHGMEQLLRPFVVANKSKFLDLPEHSFRS